MLFIGLFTNETMSQTSLRDTSVNPYCEKMYVHTDKDFFVTGETIWFKIYNVVSSSLKRATLSKIAYVEVISQDQKPVLQGKIDLNEGRGNGSFIIPSSVNSGNYVLRAYTNWMKNYDASFFFQKKITIINPMKNTSASSKDVAFYDIQFFPEGGDLVTGLESIIGFKAVNNYGKGVDCKGFIIDSNNDTIQSFQSLKFGLGHFLLKPTEGKPYKAIVSFPDHKTISKDLPNTKNTGYVMRTEDGNDMVKVTVTANNAPQNSSVYLCVRSNNATTFETSRSYDNNPVVFIINKNLLKEGISTITISDYQKRPVCERLYFKNPAHKLTLNISANKNEFSTRDKAEVQIMNQNSSIANLSLSVYRIDSLQTLSDENIFSYLWLSSELKGEIESPDYYFSDATEASEALNNLLLTQGWRRIVTSTDIKSLPEYEGHLLKAIVTDKRTGSPAANIPVYLTIPGERFQFISGVSNAQGEILFSLKKFYGANQLILQTSPGNNNYSISLNDPFSEDSATSSVEPLNLTSESANILLQHSINTQIENSYNKEKTQQYLLPDFYDTTAFYGKPDRKYFLDDYTRFGTMEEVMREYVTDVRVRKQKDGFHYRVADIPHKLFFEDDPLVLLDGVPVFNTDKIISFDPLKVKKLEVVTRKQYHNASVYSGIVSYTTYKGDLGGFQLEPDAIVIPYEGLQFEREFYSPSYTTEEQQSSRIPDYRNVLYWKPDIQMKDKADLSFYTSDIPGKYVIIVEGIDSAGSAGSAVSFIEVKDDKK